LHRRKSKLAFGPEWSFTDRQELIWVPAAAPYVEETTMSETTLELTLAQIKELRRLADALRDALGNDLTNPDVLIGQHVANYFRQLAVDAAAEKIPPRPATEEIGISTRAALAQRRIALTTIQNTLGRKLTPQELLDRLKLAGPVEEAIADTVRRDVERLAP
jgi:hypothetical protein